MLGKRNRRAHAFSICHAVLLAGFIALSQLLGLGGSDDGTKLSGRDAIAPAASDYAHRCAYSTSGQSCVFLLKASQAKSGSLDVLIWHFGIQL